MHWKPADGLVLKLIHGSAYRPANVTEDRSKAGPLAHEKVRGDELAVEWLPSRSARVSASYYRNRASQLIGGSVDLANDTYVYRNLGRLKAEGVEFEHEMAFSTGARLRSNLSLARPTDSGEMPIAPYAPRRMLKVLGSQPLGGGWTAGAEWQAVSRRAAAAGYGTVNLNLSQDLKANGMSVGLSVQDVFDRRHDDPGNDPVLQPRIRQAGRSLLLKLDLRR